MAKRANPFLDDFIPQSKVHVGVKKLLVNNEEHLKKVYEKTLGLLFKGAKKLPVESTVNNNNDISQMKSDNMKQLFINKNGTLQHSGAMVVNPKTKVGLPDICCGVSGAEMRCAYCEMQLCACSQLVCVSCQRPHCARCSLTGSDGGAVCVSCYP